MKKITQYAIVSLFFFVTHFTKAQVTIYDIQYVNPAGNTDVSPYFNQLVTTTGTVTASIEPNNLGSVFIQQEGLTEWAGIQLKSGIGLDTLEVGDLVTVTGYVGEDSGFTVIEFITNIEVIGTASILPLVLSPDVFTNYSLASNEKYEGMLIELKNPLGKVTVVNNNPDNPNNFAEWKVGNDPLNAEAGCRVLTGRQTSSVISSLNVSYVNDLIWENNSGNMNVTPIVINNGDQFEAIRGIIHYNFGNMKLLPRNNDDCQDFTNASPPANDNCIGVIDLGGETSPLTATTAGALNDFEQDCLTTTAPDVVYSINVPDGFRLMIEQTSNYYDSKHRLSYGASCPGDVLIICTDNPDTNQEIWDNSTGATQTVYWVQSASSSERGTFTLAWTVAPIPTCEIPISLAVNPTMTTANISWIAPATTTPTGYNWEIQPDGIVQGTPGAVATGSTVATITNDTAVGLTESTSYDLYVQSNCGVDGTSAWAGPFSFTTDSPPPTNDEPCNAIALPIGTITTGGTYTNVNATIDPLEISGSCWLDYEPSHSVWFSFVAPAEGNVRIGTKHVDDGTLIDTQITIYAETDCNEIYNSYNEVGCDEDDDNNTLGFGGQAAVGDFTGLTPGDTYYVQVDGGGNNVGTFDMSITIPIVNDDCVDAIALDMGTETSIDNTGATDSGVTGSCDSGIISDIWYSFVGTVTGEVYIDAGTAQVSIFDDCTTTTEIACNPGNNVPVTGLTNGTTYYLRITDDGTSKVPGVFTLKINDVTLDLKDEVFNRFKYFPNPTLGNLSLRAQDNIQAVFVYNIIGQEVLHSTPNSLTHELDMSSLDTGAYFLKIRIKDTVQYFKVFKK